MLWKECNIVLVDVSKICENKYGCSDQYRCATAFYLMLMLYHTYNIINKRDFVSPGHDKYVVDNKDNIEKIHKF